MSKSSRGKKQMKRRERGEKYYLQRHHGASELFTFGSRSHGKQAKKYNRKKLTGWL